MENPLISVVMSVYNGEQFLCEAVESILRQSFRDFEFIVVNDGSTDGTANILERYRTIDSRVRTIQQANHGLVASLNRGIHLAKGKYVARMDADDVAVTNRLKWQVEAMDQRPALGALGGAVEVIDSAGRVVDVFRFPTTDLEIKNALLVGECSLCHPATLIRLDAVRSVGGYRSVVVDAEDYDLWLRIGEQYQLANLRTPVLRYRRHPSQVSIGKFKQQALSNLAARSSAFARRSGKEDFLDGIQEITPQVLIGSGMSEKELHAALARGYLTRIRSMTVAGEYKLAKETMDEMLSSLSWADAERPLVAEARLLAALLQWRQRRSAKSLRSILHAIAYRPIVLARPLKPMLRRLGVNARFDIFVARCTASIRSGKNGCVEDVASK